MCIRDSALRRGPEARAVARRLGRQRGVGPAAAVAVPLDEPPPLALNDDSDDECPAGTSRLDKGCNSLFSICTWQFWRALPLLCGRRFKKSASSRRNILGRFCWLFEGLTRWIWMVFDDLFGSNRQNPLKPMENHQKSFRMSSGTSLPNLFSHSLL